MSSPALAASKRADARLAQLIPKLVETRREMARLHAEEARLLAEARRIADEWAAEEDPGSRERERVPAPIRRGRDRRRLAGERPHRATADQRRRHPRRRLPRDPRRTRLWADLGRACSGHRRAGAIIERAELRAEFEASVLDYAKSESASRLAPIAKRRAEWFADAAFDDRHRRAREGRRAWVDDLDDGMSELRLIGPTVLVHAAHDRLDPVRSRSQKQDTAGDAATGDPGTDNAAEPESEDTRTLDQLRADILLDLILAADPVAHDTGLAAIHATVSVTVPVLALIDDGIRDPFESMHPRRARPDRHRHRTNARRRGNRMGSDPDPPGHRSRPRGRPLHAQRAAPPAPAHQRPALPVPRLPHARPDEATSTTPSTYALGGQDHRPRISLISVEDTTPSNTRRRGRWCSIRAVCSSGPAPPASPYIDRPVSTVAFAPDSESEYETAPF